MKQMIDNEKMWASILAASHHLEGIRKDHIVAALKEQGLQYNPETKCIEEIKENDISPGFRIETGKHYVCIQSLFNSTGGKEFVEGKVYLSPKDEYLVREDNKQPEIIGAFLIKHFRPATEEEIPQDSQHMTSAKAKEALLNESKFNAGDWVVYQDKVFQVVKCGNVRILQGEHYQTYFIEEGCRPWTIADAKDGDVLASENGIILFRKIGNEEWVDVIDYHALCYTDNLEFKIQKDIEYYGSANDRDLKPATKEQRELFFSRMKEAGYEWDSDAKLLKINSTQEPVKVSIDCYNGNFQFKNLPIDTARDIAKHFNVKLIESGTEQSNSESPEKSDQDELTEFEKALARFSFRGIDLGDLTPGAKNLLRDKYAQAVLRAARKEFVEEACVFLKDHAQDFVALADEEHPPIGDTHAFYGTESLLHYFVKELEKGN